MAVNVGELLAKISLNTQEFDKGLAKAGSDFEQTGSRFSKVGGAISNVLTTAGGFVAANVIGAIGSQVGGLATQLVSSNAQFEDYGVRFQTLIKNSEDFKRAHKGITDPLKLNADAAAEAKKRMAELADFGAKTPFELPGVVEADTVLQGFGLHSQESAKKFGFSGKEIRTIAGDVASGTGQDFSEMALLLGKFSSGATGEAISRFQELGITSRDELTKMGLQFDKSGQLLSPLPQAMNTVLKLMQSKYGGLMDAQSLTFNGMMSNLQDWVGGTIRTLGAPIFDVAKEQLTGLLNALNKLSDSGAIEAFAQKLASGIGVALGFIVHNLIPLFISGWHGVSAVLSFIGDLAGDVADGFGESGLGGALYNLMGRLSDIFPVLTPLTNIFGEVGDVIQGVATIIGSIGAAIMQTDGITGDWGTDWQAIADIFGGPVADAVQSLTNTIFSLSGYIVGVVQDGDTLNDWLGQLPPSIQPIVEIIGQLIAGFMGIGQQAGPILQELIGMVQGDDEAFSAFGQTITTLFGSTLGPIIASFVAGFAERLGVLVATGQSVFSSLQSIVTSVLSIIAGFIQEHGAEIVATLLSAWQAISAYITAYIKLVATIVQTVFSAIAGFLAAHGSEIQALLSKAWETIQLVISTAVLIIRNVIIPVLSAVASFIAAHASTIEAILTAAWTIIQGVITGALDIIQGIIKTVLSLIRGDWQGAWEGVQQILRGAWEAIKGIVEGGAELIKQILSLAWDAIKGIATSAWDAIKGTVIGAVEGLKAAVIQSFENLKAAVIAAAEGLKAGVIASFNDMKGAVLGAIAGIANAALSLGSGIIDGIIRGIGNGVGALISAIQGAASRALDAAKAMLGIHSPSKVAADEVGEPIVAGMELGVLKGMPSLLATMRKSTDETIQEIVGFVDSGQTKSTLNQTGADAINALIEGTKKASPSKKQQAAKKIGTDLDDIISSATKAIKDGAEAFGLLDKVVIPAREKITAFISSLADVVADFYSQSKTVGYALKDSTALFADVAGKAVDALAKGLGAFDKLDDFQAPPREKLTALATALGDAVADFWHEAKAVLYALKDDTTSQLADTAGKALDALQKALQAFDGVADFAVPPREKLIELAQAIGMAVDAFWEVAKDRFDKAQGTTLPAFADAASKIVDAIGKALEDFKGLDKYHSVSSDAFQAIKTDIDQAIKLMILIATTSDKDGVEAASTFSEAVIKVFDAISGGIEALDKLRDYQSVASIRMQAIAADIFNATWWMAEIAKNADKEGVARAHDFSVAVQAVFDLVKSGTEAIDSLRDYQGLPKDRLASFYNDLLTAINTLVQMVGSAGYFEDQAGELASHMKNAANSIRDALNSYNQAVSDMAKIGSLPSVPAPSSTMMIQGAGRGTTVNNYNLSVATQQGLGSISSEFEMIKALA